ncbi:MAG: copper amine oxidase N-terminal domain-containing protein, partial [Caldisericia bacterium]|nr:copper amine oxidase N-terminal domain-containing protein [Caldisericia bacterium]
MCGENFITMVAGSRIINFNGPKTLSTVPFVIDEKFYVPSDLLSIISENEIELTIKGDPVPVPTPKSDALTIELIVNSKTATVDGKKVELEMAPTIIEGRTMVPLRFVTETF